MPFVRLGPEVVEETPLAKAQALLARVLKDVNDCRIDFIQSLFIQRL